MNKDKAQRSIAINIRKLMEEEDMPREEAVAIAMKKAERPKLAEYDKEMGVQSVLEFLKGEPEMPRKKRLEDEEEDEMEGLR